ncbi:hypothetical protein DYB25_010096 [Aphanomyces astaci]|uniref:CCHC-type domain-containing protein n=2 Tax=Aphanomyces astaci TaxID=112090 RepID=A0A397CU96_APHAT|nr:hypothetical protein DYB25_010096 [Aphanomyces astaci]RHY49761.1 hypothetical protein DYB30_011273 [Aphanomyces astaci]RHZ39477.1 hypothetical protein DYB26_001717 [Aphanomyces astaci]
MPRWKTRRLRQRLRQQPQRHRGRPSLDDRKAAVAAKVDLPGAPASEQDSAKYDRKKATCLKCGSKNHKVVNCPKCAPGESERLLKEQMDKWESACNKVTKLQGSANKFLGREAKIEGIVSVITTLLDNGSNVTLVTASVMKSQERDGVDVKVISPEPSVI